MLDTCIIATERGHELRTNLNYTWMRDSMLRHPNIKAVSNDWPGLATLAATDRALINEIITLANDRRTVAPPPPPTGDIAALRAELADTQLRLAQCEIECTAATTRAATLTTAAHTIIAANATTQATYATYAELVALLAVPS